MLGTRWAPKSNVHSPQTGLREGGHEPACGADHQANHLRFVLDMGSTHVSSRGVQYCYLTHRTPSSTHT